MFNLNKFTKKYHYYFIGYIILSIILIIWLTKRKEKQNKSEGFENINESKYEILPVMDPLLNYKEMCKNSIALEDHLFQRSRRCKDCIKKHFLMLEMLAEEAVTLDKEKKYSEFYTLPDEIRKIEKDYVDGAEICDIGQKLRQIRKKLMTNECFEVGLDKVSKNTTTQQIIQQPQVQTHQVQPITTRFPTLHPYTS